MSRALRRHHAARIRAKVERYVRSHTKPTSWRHRWNSVLAEDGKVYLQHYINPLWRENYEAHIKMRVWREASHRPHFCQMCRRPRYIRERYTYNEWSEE